MFDVKNKQLLPYKIALFGALGLYLWKLNKADGQTKVAIDTDKLSKAALPYLPVDEQLHGHIQPGLKRVLDVVFEKVKK